MSTGAGTRSRSGCKTCRTRKLKCDETKPICGQCRKSSRECVPSEGIAFRHAQNAGFSDANGKDLANFYKYRQKFENTYFLPVPRELSFIHITDPYASDIPDTHVQQMTMSMPPPPPLPHLPPEQNYGSEYTLAGIEDHVTSHPEYADVAASSLKAMIDPNLEANTQAIVGNGHDAPEQSGYVHSGSEEQQQQHEHDLLATTLQQQVANEDQFLKHENPMQEENINETIMKALQNTESQVKSM